MTTTDTATSHIDTTPHVTTEKTTTTITTTKMAGSTSDVECPPSAVGLPVQVSSICPYEPEQNSRLPIMVSLKMTTPQQRVGQHENPAFNRGDRLQTRPKVEAPNNTLPKVAAADITLPIVEAPDNTPDRVLHRNKETLPKEKPRAADNNPDRVLKEETSPKENPRASQFAKKRCNCTSVLSSTSSDKATRPKALANARQREDVRRSVSLDESTLSEPHTLCSNLPDSVSCPLLDEMISGRSVTKKEPQIPRVSTSREGRCEEKRSPGGHREATGQKAGFFGSMETITEDTAQVHAVKKKTPLGNQNGRTSLDVEALSLGGNKRMEEMIVHHVKR
uniref:Uncharacterized protein n=1 Tax=Branchiostoma floridae TaxID=7739 RepID=C3ZSR2_BRAFL|eukprot:XP_002588453.1 hypothetical protein BRAFLDRAFT_63402 [Branchiostoma floridae]